MRTALRIFGFLFLIQFCYRVGLQIGRQFGSDAGFSVAEIGSAIDANLVLIAVALLCLYVIRDAKT